MEERLILPSKIWCGYFDSSSFAPLKESPKRINELFEIEYYLEDGKYTYSDGQKYPIRRSFVYIGTPGEERCSDLPFKTKYVKFAAEGKLAEILKSARRYFRVYRSFEAETLLDEIITLYTMKEWDEILLQGKILSYISLILAESKRTSTDDSYKANVVIKAKDYMKEHLSEPIKLCDIAKEVSLSPNYFHTVFSEVTGISPRDYLTEHRINTAKKFLLTTELSQSEIAERCGFKTQQYMSMVFKAKTGCTLSHFRQKHRDAYWG